jgi:hypothetical protein
MAFGLLVYLLLRALSPKEIVVRNSPVPSAPATVGNERTAEEFSVRTESEVPAEPAVAASSLPVAGDDEAQGEEKPVPPPPTRLKARPPARPKRPPEGRPRGGIVENDPYGGSLKDPFQ